MKSSSRHTTNVFREMPNTQTITVMRSLGEEDRMEHNAQALVALSISSGLCLAGLDLGTPPFNPL